MTPLLAYVPFIQSLPVADYWAWLLLPLVAAVSVVYKTIKCAKVQDVPREAAVIALWIVLSMISIAAAVLLIYKIFVVWMA